MSVHSFNAVCNDQTHTLILGSMPGVASLAAVEYYAHKRNALWPIMLSMIDGTPVSHCLTDDVPYERRIDKLQEIGIGLWDVLSSCERSGSLDSAIKSDSVQMNDFHTFFKHYPTIHTVAFNGKTAERLFKRHVLNELDNATSIRWLGLPSTSPAMASLSLQQKSDQWQSALRSCA